MTRANPSRSPEYTQTDDRVYWIAEHVCDDIELVYRLVQSKAEAIQALRDRLRNEYGVDL